MTRGGKREKAGRPSTWKSGCKFEDTKLIRVPSKIADQVLEFAHRLDAGEAIKSVTKSKGEVKPPRPVRRTTSQIQGIACPHCGSTQLSRDGLKNGKQRYVCRNCGRKFMEHLAVRTLDSVSNSNDLITNS